MTTDRPVPGWLQLCAAVRPGGMVAVADASRRDRVRTAVHEATRDPCTTSHGARIHRVWGRRPEHGSPVDRTEGRR